MGKREPLAFLSTNIIEARFATGAPSEDIKLGSHRPSPQLESVLAKVSLEDSGPYESDEFPLICKPTQCIFCLGNERKLYYGRSFEY